MKLMIQAALLTSLAASPSCAQPQSRSDGGTGERGSTPLVKPAPDAIGIQNSFAQVADAIKPSVVNIAAVHIQKVQNSPHEFFFGDPNEFFHRFFGEEPPARRRRTPPREFRMEGTGSGVIINAEGYVLTNNHVVQNATQLTVTLLSGKEFKGTVVGTDPRTDLAVVKISASNPFSFAPLGDSGSVRVGDWVIAAGSPFGLEQTITAGIVSAVRQSLAIEGTSFRNLLQTDAAINRGNSGGPLVNLQGEVIGINTAIFAPTGVFNGVGFAIPINEAKNILDELINKGFVERSWIGVEIADVNQVIAQQFGLDSAEGALLNEVVKDSPAEKAGLKRGDIIVEFDGKKIATVQDLQDAVTGTDPGKTVRVRVVRDKESRTLKLRTEKMPNQQAQRPTGRPGGQPPSPEQSDWLGATVANATEELRRQYAPESANEPLREGGVIVTEAPAKSQAAQLGLVEGDVIHEVNTRPVKNVRDLKKVDVDLKKGVVLDITRRGRSLFLSYSSPQ